MHKLRKMDVLKLKLRWAPRITLKGFVIVLLILSRNCFIYQICWNTLLCDVCTYLSRCLHLVHDCASCDTNFVDCVVVSDSYISSTLFLYVTIVCSKFPHEIICSYKLFVVHYSCMLLVWSKFPLQRLQSAKTDN